jgi:uncharacterized membrane protein
MERTDLGRVMAFTDGVMAVAITLLVLNIEVPDLPSGRRDELGEELADLLPSLGAYALSFALIGRFWAIHHRLFETVRAFDGTLMALNLTFLALIALVPFAANLVDRYGEEPIADAVFGTTLGLAALAHWTMVRHVLRRGFVHEHERTAAETFGGSLALSFTAIFLLSVPAAFLSTLLAQALWVSTILARYPLRKLGGRSS